MQRSSYELSRDISWSEHNHKGYVIRDPINKDELLYLSDSEYHKLVKVVLSTESSVEVIATPRDTPASVAKRFPRPSGLPESTPIEELGGFGANLLFPLLPGWMVSDSMIFFKRNFEKFFPHYYRHIVSWMGIKRPSHIIMRDIRKFGLHFEKISRFRGVNNKILLLKISYIAVKQYLAGTPLKSTQDLGQRVRLVHGLPKSLPVSLRNWIRQEHPSRLRLVLSLLAAYKGFKGIYKDPDLSTITAPPHRLAPVNSKGKYTPSASLFQGLFNSIIDNYAYPRKFWAFINPLNIPCNVDIPVEEVPFTLTAGPNGNVSFNMAGHDAAYHFLYREDSTLIHYLDTLYKSDHRLTGVYQFRSLIEEVADKFLKGPFNPDLKGGKLSLKYESAGKVRVFAISDYWTQWAMKPIHRSMFAILRNIPSDATFDQEGKVNEFMSRSHSYIASYDLKSATDLIPMTLYKEVFESWMGRAGEYPIVQLWANVLTTRGYHFRGKVYHYTRGQPMGTLSSWSSLALVHHYLVFLASQRAKVENFRDYLVLGDDIVIGSKPVADAYVEVCRDNGVTIGLPKSYVSNREFFEFASQDILGKTNLSPISLKEILSIAQHEKFKSLTEGITHLSAKVEFRNRLMRRGYFENKGIMSALRSLTSIKDWNIISRSLARGIIPPQARNLLFLLLASSIKVEGANNLNFSKLMAFMKGDYNLLVNNNARLTPDLELFAEDLIEYLDSRLNSKLMSLTKSFIKLKMSPWEDVNPPVAILAARLVNTQGSKAVTAFLNIKKDYEKFSLNFNADLSYNRWAHLQSWERVPLNLELFNEYNRLYREIQLVSLDITIKETVAHHVHRDITPKLVKDYLSFVNQSFRDRKSVV